MGVYVRLMLAGRLFESQLAGDEQLTDGSKDPFRNLLLEIDTPSLEKNSSESRVSV